MKQIKKCDFAIVMECFAKIVNGFQLTGFKRCIWKNACIWKAVFGLDTEEYSTSYQTSRIERLKDANFKRSILDAWHEFEYSSVSTPNAAFQSVHSFSEAAVRRCSAKFTRKYLRRSLFFNTVSGCRPSNSLKQDHGTSVFFSEVCKIFKSAFFA